MPLKFAYVCDLLDRLEYQTRDGSLPARDKAKRCDDLMKTWFENHSKSFDHENVSRPALLSTLLPEQRADRTYGMQELRLKRVLCSALGIGSGRIQMLRAWEPTCSEDFGLWVANIVKESEAGIVNNTTVEQVDEALTKVAATDRRSSPQIRQKAHGLTKSHPEDILRPLVTRMPSREIKWFIRILLKKMHPVVLNERLVMWCIDPILPTLWNIQSNWTNATGLLERIRAQMQSVEGDDEAPNIHSLIKACKPEIGVKVGRPRFLKARSIEHCLKLVGRGRFSVEPKIDGEYCQVHVDLNKGGKCITIFSKSGKESTEDKEGLHRYIKRSLRIGRQYSGTRQFTSRCILEGEMVVFDTRSNDILEFNKIRKHVSRSGSFLGVSHESQTYEYEQLGIIFYDVLLIDEEALLFMPQEHRRKRLRDILDKYEGQVETGDWGVLDFSRYATRPSRAIERLERTFSKALARKCEGLVFKPTESPYLPFGPRDFAVPSPSFIKLKADYIPGLGDSMDFAVVGAAFDGREALARPSSKARWTNFLIACLVNKDQTIRSNGKPHYRAVGTISSAQQCISQQNVDQLCRRGQYCQMEYSENSSWASFKLELGKPDVKPNVLFQDPFLVEVLGSGFDKPAWENYFMLRHPRITKIHSDRGIEEVVSFDELQDLARQAMNVPENIKKAEQECLQRLRLISQPKRKKYVDRHSPFSQRGTETTSSTKASPELPNPHKICPPPLVRVDSCEREFGKDAFVSSDPMTDDNRSLIGENHLQRTESARSASPLFLRTSLKPQQEGHEYRKRKTFPLDAGDPKPKRVKTLHQNAPSREDETVVADHDISASRQQQASKFSKPKRPLTDVVANGASKTSPSPRSNNKVNSREPKSAAQKLPCFTAPSEGNKHTSVPKQPITRARSPSSTHSIRNPIIQHQTMASESPLINLRSPSEISTEEDFPNEDSQRRQQLECPEPDLTTSVNRDDSPNEPDSPTRSVNHQSPFHHYTFYLSPCISTLSWLTEDLFAVFQPGSWTATLSHWRRDIIPNADPLGPIVGESQAEPDMQKAVLVEPRRADAMDQTIDETLDLTLAAGETIQIFDWRVFEDLDELASQVNALRGGSAAAGPHKAEALAEGAMSSKPYLDPPLRLASVEKCIAGRMIGVVKQGEEDEEGVRGQNVFKVLSDNEKRRVAVYLVINWLYGL